MRPNFKEKFAKIHTCGNLQHKRNCVFISKLTQNMDFVKILKNCKKIFGTYT